MTLNPVNDESFYMKLSKGASLLLDGQVSKFWEVAQRQLHSEKVWFGMRKSLGKKSQKPKAKIDISVRLIEEYDLDYLLNTDGITAEEAKLIDWQRKLLQTKFQNCYVAVTNDNIPCYMQWLISPAENEKILETFNGLFPELKEHEALLEGAYMHPSFRGLGVMPDAMYQISEMAKEIDATDTITFVGVDNIASLKGCKSCGYYPYTLLKKKWFLFKKDILLDAIPVDTLARYETMTTKKPKQVR